jgi:hypothetical protein
MAAAREAPAARAFFSASAMERSVRARSGWRKISPGWVTRPCGRKTCAEVGHSSNHRRLRSIAPERISSSGTPSASSMAGSTASLKDLVPYSRRVTSAASTMPGTSAGMRPATGTMPFSPPGSGGERISPGSRRRSRKNWAVASFGIVPTPAMQCTLPSRVRTRIGASPPRPKCENSNTEAASMVAMPASTALPPW